MRAAEVTIHLRLEGGQFQNLDDEAQTRERFQVFQAPSRMPLITARRIRREVLELSGSRRLKRLMPSRRVKSSAGVK